MTSRSSDSDHNRMDWAASVAREERALFEFIHRMTAVGIIANSNSQSLHRLLEEFYRYQGIWVDPGQQNAIHSASEIEAVAAVKWHGYHLVEKRLLELYPRLYHDVKKLRSNKGIGH